MGDPCIARNVRAACLNCLLRASKSEYQLPLCCDVVVGLQSAAPSLAVYLADRLIEEIEFGLKTNKKIHKQRRMGYVRFLADMYNFGLLHSDTILKVLYTCLHYGHARMWPEHASTYGQEQPATLLDSHAEARGRETKVQAFDRAARKMRIASTHSFRTQRTARTMVFVSACAQFLTVAVVV